MKKIQILPILLIVISGLIVLSCDPPKIKTCPPFKMAYWLGPYDSDGDKDVLADDLTNYLRDAFPPSPCPPPDPPGGPITNNNTIEVDRCDAGIFGVSSDCLLKEYETSNATNGSGTLALQYPITVIADCDLKALADDLIIDLKEGYYCECQSMFAHIVPEDIEVEIITILPVSSSDKLIRKIHVNASFRCCGKCK